MPFLVSLSWVQTPPSCCVLTWGWGVLVLSCLTTGPSPASSNLITSRGLVS